jgi:PEP-CTERM motif
VNDIQAFTEILPNTEPLYGISIVLTVSPTVVPEPASLVLLGIGLLAPMGAWWLRLGQARAAG